MYKQGDIVKVPFPFSDNRGSKPRPAIIISNSSVNKTQDVIMAQITAKPRKDEFSYNLNPEDLESPLPNPCQVRCHKIFIIEKKLIIKKLSYLSEEKQYELYKIITGKLAPEPTKTTTKDNKTKAQPKKANNN